MSKKRKVKVVYRTKIKNVPENPSVERNRIRKEIKELEADRMKFKQKAAVELAGKKGFKKFATKLSFAAKYGQLGNQIKDKQSYLASKQKAQLYQAHAQTYQAQANAESARLNLNEMKKKSQVSFESLFQPPVEATRKALRFEDL